MLFCDHRFGAKKLEFCYCGAPLLQNSCVLWKLSLGLDLVVLLSSALRYNERLYFACYLATFENALCAVQSRIT